MAESQSAFAFDKKSVEREIVARMNALVASGKLSPCEKAVLLHLFPATGRLYIRGIASMQTTWQVDGEPVYGDRSIKAAVKTLLEDHGIPIGSSRTAGDSGYWIILSDAEAEEAERPLRNEIISMFRRLKVISPRSAFVRRMQGQLELMEAEAQ